MKKRVSVVIRIAVFFFCQELTAQTTFVKIAWESNVATYSFASSLTPDSGIVEVGYDDNFNANLVKFNRYGMIDWAKYIQTSNYSDLGCVKTFNQKIYAGGNIDTSAYLISFNTAGQKLWSGKIDYPSSSYSMITGIASDSSNLYLSGIVNLNSQDFVPFLMKVDSTGNILWCNQYGTATYTNEIVYNRALNQLFFITHNGFSSNAIVLDTAGNVLWSKLYPAINFTTVYIQNDSNYIIAGYSDKAVVLSLNQYGTINWAKKYTDTTFSSKYLSSVYISPDNNIYIGNTSSDPGVNSPTSIVKLNGSGNVIWGNAYWGFTLQLNGITGIAPNYDSGLWLTGLSPHNYGSIGLISRDTTSFTGCDATLIHVMDSTFIQQDSVITLTSQTVNLVWTNAQDTLLPLLLNQSFNCPTAIGEIPVITEATIFPNPSNGELTIKGNFPSNTQLQIFNTVGKKVIESIELPQGNNQVSVNLNLAEGMYFYQLISENEILRTDRLMIVR